MKIRTTTLGEAGKAEYYIYAKMVNEDRSIPTALEGLKPSGRRCLWTLYDMGLHSKAKHMKTARAVGETMGKLHPHGDSSLVETYVTLVNSTLPMADGSGNWGSLSEPGFAAMRYTEIRMSLYSEKVFFDKFYLPTLEYLPTYDGEGKEPLTLPCLLPNLLLNGSFGIGVGVSTSNPCFTLPSVVDVLKKVLLGESCTPKMCMTLRLTCQYEGKPITSKEEMLEFYKTGKGGAKFASVYTLDEKRKEMCITKFAPISSMEKSIEKALALKHVSKVDDVTSVKDKHATVIVKLRTAGTDNLKALADQVITEAFSASKHFDIKALDRTIDSSGQAEVDLYSSNVADLINGWVKYRITLERKACDCKIIDIDKRIAYLRLMLLAVENRRFIIQALDKKLNDQGLDEYVAKGLKITIEEARQILDLKVRRLKAMESDTLQSEVDTLAKEKKTLLDRKKSPNNYIANQLDGFVKLFSSKV